MSDITSLNAVETDGPKKILCYVNDGSTTSITLKSRDGAAYALSNREIHFISRSTVDANMELQFEFAEVESAANITA